MHFHFLSTIRAPPPPPDTYSDIHGERGILADFGFPNAAFDGGGYMRDVCENKTTRKRGKRKVFGRDTSDGECSFGRSEESPGKQSPRRVAPRAPRSRGGFNYKRAPDACLPFYWLVFTAAPPRGLAPAAHAYRAYDRCIHVYLYVYTRKPVNVGRNKDVDGKTPKIAYFSCNGDFPRVQVAVRVCARNAQRRTF